MAKVYVETSFFSVCVTTRSNPLDIGRREASNRWWAEQAGNFDLFISAEVARELDAPGFVQRERGLAMLDGLTALALTSTVYGFADVLVRERVMPGPAVAGDAVHVAAAAVHRMDYILTWNIRHLANPNKRTHLAVVCMRAGLMAPQLVTPDLLQVSDHE